MAHDRRRVWPFDDPSAGSTVVAGWPGSRPMSGGSRAAFAVLRRLPVKIVD